MIKRIILFAIYYVVTAIISILLVGGGEGTSAMLTVFFSWGYLAARSFAFNNTGLLVFYLLFLIILFMLNNLGMHHRKAGCHLIPAVLYLSGSGIASAIQGRMKSEPIHEYLIALALSVAGVIIYLLADRLFVIDSELGNRKAMRP
jgi:hypothetical protein